MAIISNQEILNAIKKLEGRIEEIAKALGVK